MNQTFDCVVIGGGAAGLSAALVLGRARRQTLVIDAGDQSNLSAHGIGGLLGHDGRSPVEFYEMARRELESYPSVEQIPGVVEDGKAVDGGFELSTRDGSTYRGRRLLMSGGMDYRFDDLPGASDLWGDTVFHCPFCHGWEVEGKPLAVRGNGPKGLHGALLLCAWSDDIVLLTDGSPDFHEDQQSKLDLAGVTIDDRRITELVAVDGKLGAIRFEQGKDLERHGLLMSPRLHQRSDLAVRLGLDFVPDLVMAEDALVIDSAMKTSVPGIYSAGDQANEMQQVAGAVASGSKAAASIVLD
ncbi:MAG: NAD(P)/FAD-dependent oxidoreductase, partial [Actinomycetota bacterium]|nr:NAD(P)/FAD-dependent oxidoreductase [Actinomycetota bacterium]